MQKFRALLSENSNRNSLLFNLAFYSRKHQSEHESEASRPPQNLNPKSLAGSKLLYLKNGNRVPRPAAPGPLTGEQKAGSDLSRSQVNYDTSA